MGLLILVVVLVIALRIYRMTLENRHLMLLLEERRLLIEKGVTDLPPLEIPEMPRKKGLPGYLAASIILLFISAAWVACAFLMRPVGVDYGMAVWPSIMLGAIGLALLLIHFIASAYERRERQEQEPPG